MTTQAWPPDYVAEFARRQERIRKIKADPVLKMGLPARYEDDPAAWINHWAVTYDPRNAGSAIPTTMPFVLFERQSQFVEFLHLAVKQEQNGLVEKCRDMGATWLCSAFSVWLWLYLPGAAVGWGSRKEQLVDKIGDPDSIFEKMRIIIRTLPAFMLPVGFNSEDHMSYMKIRNPENGSTITGEAGDNIGRGGRKLIYFKDESAHYERPEKIEAALGDNTNCQIDISSVNGLGNVFHRRREAGVEWAPGQPMITTSANVFIMDWRDHPAKTQDWYDRRREKAESDGLQHVFAQEVDRDYSGAVEGVIIPSAWVTSAIDAHLALGFDDTGGWSAGLDVADEGGDRNALAIAKGVILQSAEAWGDGDVGKTTRRAVEALAGKPLALQYDSIGVGAGVKSEANRLKGDGLLPANLTFVPWNAAMSPLNPEGRVIQGDAESPFNKDFYKNLKAQGWWELRRRFERTHKAVTEGHVYPVDQLISLPSSLPGLGTIRKELSQAVRTQNGRMQLVVEKSPEGTKSPNLADAIVMLFWPNTAANTGFLDFIRSEHETVMAQRLGPQPTQEA